jgi:hypothetical protein
MRERRGRLKHPSSRQAQIGVHLVRALRLGGDNGWSRGGGDAQQLGGFNPGSTPQELSETMKLRTIGKLLAIRNLPHFGVANAGGEGCPPDRQFLGFEV